MVGLVVCLVIAIIVAAAALGVVKALLALPPMASLAPYNGVIYALIVLLVILLIIQYCFGGIPGRSSHISQIRYPLSPRVSSTIHPRTLGS